MKEIIANTLTFLYVFYDDLLLFRRIQLLYSLALVYLISRKPYILNKKKRGLCLGTMMSFVSLIFNPFNYPRICELWQFLENADSFFYVLILF